MNNLVQEQKTNAVIKRKTSTPPDFQEVIKNIDMKSLHTIPIGDDVLRAVPELTNHPIDRSVTGCKLRNPSKKIIRIELKRKVQVAKSHYGAIGFAGGDTNLYSYVES